MVPLLCLYVWFLWPATTVLATETGQNLEDVLSTYKEHDFNIPCGDTTCDVTYQYCHGQITGFPECFLCSGMCDRNRVGTNKLYIQHCIQSCPVFWYRQLQKEAHAAKADAETTAATQAPTTVSVSPGPEGCGSDRDQTVALMTVMSCAPLVLCTIIVILLLLRRRDLHNPRPHESDPESKPMLQGAALESCQCQQKVVKENIRSDNQSMTYETVMCNTNVTKVDTPCSTCTSGFGTDEDYLKTPLQQTVISQTPRTSPEPDQTPDKTTESRRTPDKESRRTSTTGLVEAPSRPDVVNTGTSSTNLVSLTDGETQTKRPIIRTDDPCAASSRLVTHAGSSSGHFYTAPSLQMAEEQPV